MTERLKVAVIAGEVSGDLLGADLVRALKARYPGSIELVGVGGEALEGRAHFSFRLFRTLNHGVHAGPQETAQTDRPDQPGG